MIKSMKQIFRFKISVKATPRSVVRQIVSLAYSDQVCCQADMYIQLAYLKQLQIRVVGYYIDSEFIDSDQLEKELGYVF